MTKFSSFKKISMLLTLAVAFTVSSIAVAQTAADPNARARAAAARSQANRAESTAITAKTTADQAKADAAAADAKAQQAKADAQAVGATAAANVLAAEGRLNTAVARARGAAFGGDRALERKFREEASAIKAEIEQLKRRAQHECGAFEDKDVQKSCLTVFEKNVAAKLKSDDHKVDKEVELGKHVIDKQTEQNKDNLAGKKEEIEAIVGQANNLVDKAQGAALGCTPKSVTKADGTISTENHCVANPRSLVIVAKSVTKYGATTFNITPASVATSVGSGEFVDDQGQPRTSKATKAAVIIGSTLAGGAIGFGAGMAAFPNEETDDHGRLVTRNWEGGLGGAALGAGVGLVSSAIWALVTN